jgi:hypothetical protein
MEHSTHHQALGCDRRRPGESGWGKAIVASGRLDGCCKVVGTFTSPELSKLGWRLFARRGFILGGWLASYPLSLESLLGVS